MGKCVLVHKSTMELLEHSGNLDCTLHKVSRSIRKLNCQNNFDRLYSENLQNMKPVRNCTGFIFCTIYAVVYLYG